MTQQPAFGRHLRRLREARGLSQRDLARGLVTPSYISLLETGRRIPTLAVVTHLADVLGVPVNELLDRNLPLHRSPSRIEGAMQLADLVTLRAAGVHDYTAAATTLNAALDEARAERNAPRMIEIGLRLQHLLFELDRRTERVTLLQELHALPGVAGSAELSVAIATDLASALCEAGQLSAARAMAVEAVDRVGPTSLRGSDQHVRLLGVLVSVLVEHNELDRASTAVRDLIETAQSATTSGIRGRAHLVAALAYAQLGRAAEAREHLEQARLRMASPTLPLREWTCFCRSSASILLDVGGDVREVRTWLQNAETSASMLGLRVEQARVRMLWAEYQLAAGLIDHCLATTADLLAAEPALSRIETVQIRIIRALATGLAGHREEAVRDLRQFAYDCEEMRSYRLAVQVWHLIDQFRGPPPGTSQTPQPAPRHRRKERQ